jgi:hypothetical protein
MSTASGDDYLVAPDLPARVAVPETRATQWPFLLVIAVGLLGLALIGLGQLQQGVVALTLAVGLAAILRLVLPEQSAGWLVSRRRSLDVLGFAVIATALVATVFLLK